VEAVYIQSSALFLLLGSKSRRRGIYTASQPIEKRKHLLSATCDQLCSGWAMPAAVLQTPVEGVDQPVDQQRSRGNARW
jgi:hypothetical protein